VSEDPFRADAALVWRVLDALEPGLSAPHLAWLCFPWPEEGPASSIAAIRKRSIRRVLDSIVWMRHKGVVITAIPTVEGETVFRLGAHPVVVTPFIRERESVVVTPEMAQPEVLRETKTLGEGMDVWHGK
jgi:hypothetical protein